MLEMVRSPGSMCKVGENGWKLNNQYADRIGLFLDQVPICQLDAASFHVSHWGLVIYQSMARIPGRIAPDDFAISPYE